jgi:hypothetical protein
VDVLVSAEYGCTTPTPYSGLALNAVAAVSDVGGYVTAFWMAHEMVPTTVVPVVNPMDVHRRCAL